MRALISISFALFAFFLPLLVGAQTTQVLETANAKVEFPSGWKVKAYQIGDVAEKGPAATIEDAFTLKEVASCATKTFGKAYQAVQTDEDGFRLFIVEFIDTPSDAPGTKNCILKALNLPVRSVDWEDKHLRATAELKMGEVWTKRYISSNVWRSCHPDYRTIAIVAVGPSSKSKRVDSMLDDVGFSRLPIDCSDLKFHLVCDRENINCAFADDQSDP